MTDIIELKDGSTYEVQSDKNELIQNNWFRLYNIKKKGWFTKDIEIVFECPLQEFKLLRKKEETKIIEEEKL